jgi:hypothetical protein
LASNSNNDMNDTTNNPLLPSPPRIADPSGAADPPVTAAVAPVVDAPAVSAAVIKFRSCRWRRPPEDGTECCGHRDVLPIAGTNSFDAEAWCPDCTYFKLRRTPKKREESYRY